MTFKQKLERGAVKGEVVIWGSGENVPGRENKSRGPGAGTRMSGMFPDVHEFLIMELDRYFIN